MIPDEELEPRETPQQPDSNDNGGRQEQPETGTPLEKSEKQNWIGESKAQQDIIRKGSEIPPPPPKKGEAGE
jgi:hypothetical protein